MARRKNVKRIDPKYFLHETVFREGDEAEMVQAGEDALADMGEEEILAQVAQLPPEAQAEIEATVEATVEKVLQLNEGPLVDRLAGLGIDGGPDGWATSLVPMASGAIGGATHAMIMGLGAGDVILNAGIYGGLGIPAGIVLAYVSIRAKKRLRDAGIPLRDLPADRLAQLGLASVVPASRFPEIFADKE